MNQVRDWFEHDLRSLQPKALSPELTARLQALAPKPETEAPPAVKPSPRPRRVRANFFMLLSAACLAAALGAVFVWHVFAVGRPRPHASGPGLAPAATLTPSKPIQYTVTPTAVHDEGVLTLSDGKPVRRVRRQYIREVHLLDTESGTIYTVREPAEDVLLVRLEAY